MNEVASQGASWRVSGCVSMRECVSASYQADIKILYHEVRYHSVMSVSERIEHISYCVSELVSRGISYVSQCISDGVSKAVSRGPDDTERSCRYTAYVSPDASSSITTYRAFCIMKSVS